MAIPSLLILWVLSSLLHFMLQLETTPSAGEMA